MTPDLHARLEHADAETRRLAVMQLAEVPIAEARGVILRALGDEDWRVRKEAVRVAASRFLDLDVVEGLVEALSQGDNVGLRNSAREVLSLAPPQTSDALVAALDRVPASARKFVVDVLGDSRGPAATATLVSASFDADPNVVAAALDALARIGGHAAEDALRGQLRSPHASLRTSALDGLRRLSANVRFEEIEHLLDDPLVRRTALDVAGRSGDPRAIPYLTRALEGKGASLVAAAAEGLMRVAESGTISDDELAVALAARGSEACAQLRRLASQSEGAIRKAAVHLLVVARDAAGVASFVDLAAEQGASELTLRALRAWGLGAIDPLLRVEAGSNGARRSVALELAADLALVHEGDGADAIIAVVMTAIRRALNDTADPGAQIAACRCLEPCVSETDAEALLALTMKPPGSVAHAASMTLEALAKTHPEVVRRAVSEAAVDGETTGAFVRLMGRVSGAEAIDRLQTALSATAVEVRTAAIDALSHVGGSAATELVAFALGDESVAVQIAAATTLGRVRDEGGRDTAISTLRLALTAESHAVRSAAARALAELGDTHSIELLRELFRNGEGGAALAAMESLRALGDAGLSDLLVESLSNEDDELVKEALRGIRSAKKPNVARMLALGLEHRSWNVRALGATLLGTLGEVSPAAAREARAALLTRRDVESDDMVRGAIEEALAELAQARGA